MPKKTKKKANTTEVSSFSQSKSVEVKKISNGYIVSQWGKDGQKEKFAKTKKEAKNIAGKML